ncbi:MAG: tripartite tricarboxylate transporter substrate binding protein [Actinobacteria bacterium]|nr:tripartite tricarboxylate transporter substrate binding protein [Actinomycetota bacterium]NBY71709.1 tripartite tricarboxylate transporter substrate binding protein [Betaproteobacteria bacterium]
MKKSFVSFLGLILLLTASYSISQSTSTWPNKPIRIIVPFATGGNVDVTARVVGAGMSKVLNQSVIVENRVGAGGKIGAEAAMKSAPDGYTLMMGSNSSLSVAPNLYKDWPYDPQTGIAPVTYLAAVPFVLVVRTGLGPKNIAELIALAKQKPGGLSMASAGNGTSNHLVGEYFQAVTGTQFLHVPYKGAGPALQDVVAGRVDLLFDQVSSSTAFIEQGRVTPLAVSSNERWKSLPQTPTFIESGLSKFSIINFTGLVAPPGTPEDIITALQRAASAALEDDAVKKSFAGMGVQAVGDGPKQFNQLIREDLQRWASVIRDKGIKLD